jgi:methylthioribose-1-phosphate isomerase
MAVRDIFPVKFDEGKLYFLDQTLLPNEEVYREMKTADDVYDAIRRLVVRGAPAIGVAAGYGMWIALRSFFNRMDLMGIPLTSEEMDAAGDALRDSGKYLISARPTAVNLEWAVRRMENRFDSLNKMMKRGQPRSVTAKDILNRMLDEADAIRREDEESCLKMGEYGLELLKPGMGILTHCNAGVLATAGYGTALAPIHLGQERGYDFRVYADETRPLLQGARLTAWELMKSGVDVTLICDDMASLVMKNGFVDAVVVGCDRMAANGDGANKIGTSGVAILAKEYGIPFYMFVPTSTIDMDTRTGSDIVIEERSGEEIRSMWYERPMAPEGVKTFDPAFDVTDHSYITAIVTERGIVRPPFAENIAALMEDRDCIK